LHHIKISKNKGNIRCARLETRNMQFTPRNFYLLTQLRITNQVHDLCRKLFKAKNIRHPESKHANTEWKCRM